MLGYIFTTLLTFLLAVSFVPITASAHDDETDIIESFECFVDEFDEAPSAEASYWWCYDEEDYDALHETKNGAFSLSLRVDVFDGENLLLACSGETSTKEVDVLEGDFAERLEQACTPEGCDPGVRSCHVETLDVEEDVICRPDDPEECRDCLEEVETLDEENGVEIVWTGDVKAIHQGSNGGSSGNKNNPGEGGGRHHNKAIVECDVDT